MTEPTRCRRAAVPSLRTLPGVATATAAALGLAATHGSAQLPRLSGSGDPVGCAVCEGPLAFGQIRGLSFLPSGTVVVLDRDEPMLRVFTREGDLAATFGRAGDGPGELGGLTWGVAALADGTLIVGDMRRAELTRFASDGAFLETRRVEGPVMDVSSGPGGTWAAYQTVDWSSFTGGVHLLGPGFLSLGSPVPTTDGVLADAKGQPATPGLFSAAVGPDGRVALGAGHEFRIVVLDRTGAPLQEIRRDVPRVPRTDEEMEQRREALRRGPGGGRGNPESGAARPDVDPLHPHFAGRALAYDGAGRLWVRTARGGPGATVFDVFDRGGGFLGEVRIPFTLGLFTFAGGELAGVVTDPDLGVERVHRWTVR